MAILRVKDSDGNIIEIPAIKGDTPKKGVDYFTPEDIREITNGITLSISNEGLLTISKEDE